MRAVSTVPVLGGSGWAEHAGRDLVRETGRDEATAGAFFGFCIGRDPPMQQDLSVTTEREQLLHER